MLNAISFYRVSRWLYLHHIPVLPKLITLLIFLIYIAKGSIVMGGITIGNNVTIGANAVVTKPIPDNAIVAGVPTKILRTKE